MTWRYPPSGAGVARRPVVDFPALIRSDTAAARRSVGGCILFMLAGVRCRACVLDTARPEAVLIPIKQVLCLEASLAGAEQTCSTYIRIYTRK